MIQRFSKQVIRHRLADYPAVALAGPRQCGKTTLAHSFAGVYFDLEQEADRLRLDLEWSRLVANKRLIILDEAQAWPEVFRRLRGEIDQDRKRHGRFLLLGSVAPRLMTQVSESLAGRLSVVELTPFLLGELPTKTARDRLWLCGGYPDGGVLQPGRFPRWQDDYLSLLIQRDLPAWGLPAKPQVTSRLARMLAIAHGQSWNASQVGQGMGLNFQTVNSYLDYLEGAFLIRRLLPYYGNIRKRLVKSPKVYWRDSGLLHALMGVDNRDMLLAQPWVGASWEGFVIEQILGALGARGQRFDAFYLRTSDQYELGLMLERGTERWAIEVKLTANPGPGDLSRLNKTADMVDATRRFLISQTPKVVDGKKTVSCNLAWFLKQLP